MKLNEGKCHRLISGFKHEAIWTNIGESKEKKLLGLNIDRELKFTLTFLRSVTR